MGDNFQSMQHFLPELIIICTILFTIIADLLPSIKRYSFNITLFGMIATGVMMFLLKYSDKIIFKEC